MSHTQIRLSGLLIIEGKKFMIKSKESGLVDIGDFIEKSISTMRREQVGMTYYIADKEVSGKEIAAHLIKKYAGAVPEKHDMDLKMVVDSHAPHSGSIINFEGFTFVPKRGIFDILNRLQRQLVNQDGKFIVLLVKGKN